MTFENITNKNQKTLVEYWKSHGLTIEDFYCRECGKFMVDLKNLKDAGYSPSGNTLQEKFEGYVESEKNRWLIKGRCLSGKVYFRHLCWDCFFKHLPEIENISKRALKSSWYRDIKAGNLRPPAPWTSPSKYFKLLFDITDDELEVEHKKFDTASLESFIKRFGETDGKKKYDEYRSRQAYTCSKEYMMGEKGMTEDEWNEYNSSRAVTLDNLISKHGVEIGRKMWEDYCNRQSYVGCKLEYFIEKYGEEKGKEEYERVCRSKLLSYENFLRKYGKEEGERKWREFENLRKNQYSKISQKLFSEIDRKDLYSKENSIYASKNGSEYSIEVDHDGNKSIYHPDFILGKKIIEFYGDYFHANPMKYKDDGFVIGHRTVGEIREQNRIREEALKAAGYSIKIVWEYDYNHNRKNIVEECLRFLHE